MVQIAERSWEVLAVLDQEDNCQVLDLMDQNPKPGNAMNDILTEKVPQLGPDQLFSTEMCAPLRDGIHEFRKNPRGAKMRVLWFYDRPSTVVCTHGFMKDERVCPPEEIDFAVRLKDTYESDKESDRLEIYDMDNRRVR